MKEEKKKTTQRRKKQEGGDVYAVINVIKEDEFSAVSRWLPGSFYISVRFAPVMFHSVAQCELAPG